VRISRDYLLKTRTSKQPIGEIPRCELIPSHPLKYPRSKQGRTGHTTISLLLLLDRSRTSILHRS
jgi:hypothetical protein